MKVVLQRCLNGSVEIGGKINGSCSVGYVALVGFTHNDTEEIVDKMIQKIIYLRVFEDENGKMNLSLADIKGELLIVSQFTLFGDCRKGRRPSFDKAGHPEKANQLYEKLIKYCNDLNFTVEHGSFGADMKVNLENDGPVTLLLDSKKLF